MSLLWAKRGWLTPGSQTIRALDRFGASDAWDFVDNSYMRAGVIGPSGLTVTRASSGYAETSDGRLVEFGSGVLRRTDKGILVEGARTNLLTRSQEFDDAAWSLSRMQSFGSGSVANDTTSPDGTTTADFVVEDATLGEHQLTQSVTTTAAAHTFSVFAKAGARTWLAVGIADSGNTNRVSYFDLGTGATGTVDTGITTSIQPLANGWYRCIATVATARAGSNTIRIYLSTGDNTISYTGDGTSGIYIWGAQLEAASFPSSYIKTEGSTVTRAADLIQAVSFNGLAASFSLAATYQLNVLNASSSQEAATTNQSGAFATNSVTLTANNTAGSMSATATASGVGQGFISIAGATANAVAKLALRVASNDAAMCFNAGAVSTDATYTLPSDMNLLTIGARPTGFAHLEGYMRQFAFIPRALTNSELQGITT